MKCSETGTQRLAAGGALWHTDGWMRLASTWSWTLPAWAALLAAGCGGGQSGTESEGGRTIDPMITLLAAPCACALAGTGTAVRATVLGQDECGVLRAEVLELLGRGPLPAGPALAVGDELGGTPLLPCAEGLSVAAGDEVLIVHVPGAEATDGCPERLGCQAGCPQPGLTPDGEIDAASNDAYERCAQRCELDTASMCAAHAEYAQLHGQLLVAPWAPELQLSSAADEPLSLPRAELPVLLDPTVCEMTLYPDAGIPDFAAAGGPVGTDELPDAGADAGQEGAPSCGAL